MTNKNSKKGNRLVAGSVALAAAIGIIYFMPKTEEAPKTWKGEPETVQESKPLAPAVPMEYWQRKQWSGPKDASLTPDREEWAQEQLEGSKFEASSRATLANEEAGFTSDLTQMSTKGGGINPFFTYWTDDLFNAQSRLMVEALVNPLYGGWTEAQVAEDISMAPDAVKDLFTPEFLALPANRMPLLLGSASGVVEVDGATWIGEVVSSDAKWKWSDGDGFYRVHATYAVDYKGRTEDGATVTMPGVLKLTFVPSDVEVAKQGGFRVQIEEASFRMGEDR